MFVFTQIESDSEDAPTDIDSGRPLHEFVYQEMQNDENDPPKGLFWHLRSQCSNENPHNRLVKVAASSSYEDYSPENVLDWGSQNFWLSRDQPNNWISFDLCGKSFIVKALAIYTLNQGLPRHWTLEGSNDGRQWTDIHDSDNDARFDTEESSIVPLDIQNALPFKHFRLLSKANWWFDSLNGFGFASIEFFGVLSSSA
jgi:hypothetical protein